MDKICRNCAYWSGDRTPLGTADEFAPCSQILTNDGSNALEDGPFWVNVKTPYPELIQGIFLNTSPDFGCNQWKEIVPDAPILPL